MTYPHKGSAGKYFYIETRQASMFTHMQIVALAYLKKFNRTAHVTGRMKQCAYARFLRKVNTHK